MKVECRETIFQPSSSRTHTSVSRKVRVRFCPPEGVDEVFAPHFRDAQLEQRLAQPLALDTFKESLRALLALLVGYLSESHGPTTGLPHPPFDAF